MIYTSKRHKAAVVDWDWKAQPSWREIGQALDFLGTRPYFHEVDTGSDEYAVLITYGPLEHEEAQRVYREIINDANDNYDPDSHYRNHFMR